MEHDIVKMYENCELFNGRLSELTKTAHELKERLLNYIRPVDPAAENESKKRKSDIRYSTYISVARSSSTWLDIYSLSLLYP